MNYPLKKTASRDDSFQETMKLSTNYTTIVQQAEWNKSKGERGKNPYKISQTLDVINHGKSMSHQQDVATRRDIQCVRKEIGRAHV